MGHRVAEAIILVGGAGTRLRPLTLRTPKPLLPVGGVPILAHQLAQVQAAGIEHVVLATSYRAEVFGAYLGDRSGIRVEHRFEPEPLGTAGAVRHAAQALTGAGESVLVVNGDILTALDLRGFAEAHTAARADVSLPLIEVPDPRQFGSVTVDDSGRVRGFVEKPAEEDHAGKFVNGAVYLFRRDVIDGIPRDRPVSTEREVFPRLLADGAHLHGYACGGYWADLGRPESLVRASADVVLGVMRSPVGGAAGNFRLMPGAVTHGAELGGGTVIGEHARVEPGASVFGSIVRAGARIGAGTHVRHSIVGVDAVIGADCVLDGVVVGDNASLGAGNELRHGLRVWQDAVLGDGAVRFAECLD
ncbi:NDP-sugar synthase [Dactylosporangium sp. NPDC051485]|uniref:NDP-sugar synthase n=1 Tax=Dactylosporangium sp. NPDC051485 TaxID=3154846 RepID=UPI0034316136